MKSDSDDKCTFIICCDLNANANCYEPGVTRKK